MEVIGLLGVFSWYTFEDIRRKSFGIISLVMCGAIGVMVNLYTGSLSWTSLISGASLGLILYIISTLSEEKIGKGDAVLVLVTGLYIGFWNTLALLFFATLFAGLFGVALMLIAKKNKNYELPFAPFMLAAYVTLLLIQYTGQI